MPHESFQNLLKIVSRLRAPDGCPWDRKQTISSLFECLQSELQEVKEAIEKNDNENLKEELGDLTFTILMMAEIASEKGDFNIKQILDESAKKLVERHTWVFGSDKVNSAEEALELWKKNKEKLKNK